jgi:hypothetical protein
MNSQEAKTFVEWEKHRRALGAGGLSDTEFLRRRERLPNGLTMAFSLLALASLICAGALGRGILGWSFAVVGSALLGRQCSAHANRCRDARQFLEQAAKP